MRTKRNNFSFPGNRPSAICWTLNFGILLAVVVTCRADTNFVTAQSQIVTNQFEAYAQVEPIATLPVRAGEAGLVTGLKIIPGDSVKAGQKLAELGGPEISALLAQNEAAVNSARTNLISAQESLTIQQQQLASHISTRQTILQAESVAAQAQANLDAAEAQLQVARQLADLKSPVDGLVLAINATDGERVSTGDTIFMLQSADRLWLKAAYYGADAVAIQTGMTGQFSPADGGKPIPVKVCSVFGSSNSDGGESVGLVATSPTTRWLNGETGTVTLNGIARSLVAVPTRALILEQGKWWVLVHTANGNHPQVVTPGPALGWQTFIERGLEPGAEVVVENTYLEFHHDVSSRYQPPD